MSADVCRDLTLALWRTWHDHSLAEGARAWTALAACTGMEDQLPETVVWRPIVNSQVERAVEAWTRALRDRKKYCQKAMKCNIHHPYGTLTEPHWDAWASAHRSRMTPPEIELLQRLWTARTQRLRYEHEQFTFKWITWLNTKTRDAKPAWCERWNDMLHTSWTEWIRARTANHAQSVEWQKELPRKVCNGWVRACANVCNVEEKYIRVIQRLLVEFVGTRMSGCLDTPSVRTMLHIGLTEMIGAREREAPPSATHILATQARPPVDVSASDLQRASLLSCTDQLERMQRADREEARMERWWSVQKEQQDDYLQRSDAELAGIWCSVKMRWWRAWTFLRSQIQDEYEQSMSNAVREEHLLRAAAVEVVRSVAAEEMAVKQTLASLREQVGVCARDLAVVCQALVCESELSALTAFYG
jgi:hypothetical protein